MSSRQFNPYANLGDLQAAGLGQPGISRLEIGRVYTGIIKQAFHGDNLYYVEVDNLSIQVSCKWAAGIFSPLLGIRTKFLPPVDMRVVVLASSVSTGWIISTIPGETYDVQAGGANSMVEMQLADQDLEPFKQKFDGMGLTVTNPNDLLEGEFVIGNNFGVAVQFLTTMIKMQASERAKVEAILMDDMVRIVSETFKHFSSFGDFQIYNDGRLNVRFDGTSYEFESFGKKDNKEPLVDVQNKLVDFKDEYTQTGRWRFSEYIGFLGDFIHTFVTEPNNALAAIAEEAVRPGKARMQMHSDGSVIMQSVADISIERVCRIVSPTEIRRQDDPEGNKKTEFDQLNKDYLKIWDYGKDMSKAHYASYQLRQYARWLSCYHSFARFLQMDKDWKLPKETDFQHSWDNNEEDVKQANEGKEKIYDVYATFRIMRDGSILIMDGYNSAISMVRGNIQMSSVRHIELDAAGDIKINAGQNIYIKARRNIEISAIVGGLTLKARAWWKALCEWGTVWIKSDAVDLSVESAPTPDSEQDPEPEIHAAGIFLDVSKSQFLAQSERRATISVIGQPDSSGDITDTTASVVLQSQAQDIRAIGKRHVALKSEGQNDGKIIFDATQAKAIILKASKFLTKVTEFFTINNKLKIDSSGRVNAEAVRANNGNFKIQVSGPSNPGTPLSNAPIPLKPHGHHLQLFNNTATPISLPTSGEIAELEDYNSSSVVPVDPHTEIEEPPNGPDWAYTKEDKNFNGEGYQTDPKDDETFQPMAQQRLAETDTDNIIDRASYNTWTWQQDNKLKSGPRTDDTSVPFPGADAQEKKFTSGQALHNPLDEEYKEQKPEKAQDPQNSQIVRKYIKYNS